MMKQEQQTQEEPLILKNKMKVLSTTLRNCADLKFGRGMIYCKESDEMCTFGALAFRSGIPKDELGIIYYGRILERYGFTNDEIEIMGKLAFDGHKTPTSRIINFNDKRAKNFEDVADFID